MSVCPKCGRTVPEGSAVCPSCPVPPTASGEGDAPCPVCGNPVLEPGEAFRCPSCRTLHHEDCWDRIDGCARPGCDRQGREIPVLADIEVFAHVPLAEALVMQGVLASSRIPSFLDEENASTLAIPVDGILGQVRLLVPRARFEEAREALSRVMEKKAPGDVEARE
jgi:hypothetical protein